MATALITQPDRTFVAASGCFDLQSQLSDRGQLFTTQDVASKPDPILRSIPVRSRGAIVHFQYWDYGAPQPSWLMPALQGFANLVTLPANWDKEGASRIDGATINRALAATDRLLDADSPAPSIVPLSNGGLQIEWHRRRRDLEIEFTPSGRTEFYFFDGDTAEEHEGPVGSNFVNLQGYLQRIL